MEGGKYTLFSSVPAVASPYPPLLLPAHPLRLLRLFVSTPPASLLLERLFLAQRGDRCRCMRENIGFAARRLGVTTSDF